MLYVELDQLVIKTQQHANVMVDLELGKNQQILVFVNLGLKSLLLL